VSAGGITVWVVRLDELDEGVLPPARADDLARAERFRSAENGRRYLRAHCALEAIVGAGPLALGVHGKPYLRDAPGLKFSLSRSGELALVAVSDAAEVGVDVERVRRVPEHEQIAQRFFPPSEAAELALEPEPRREREFLRRWTRIEARLKALGVGLYGAGAEFEGEWTVEEVDAGPDFAAAVAAPLAGLAVEVREFRAASSGPPGVVIR
jgi:4'-phosphopantetheinyl transferase